MAATQAPEKHILASFLSEAFIPEEFVRFLHERTCTAELANELSTRQASAEFFFEAVLLLFRHGLVDPALFLALGEARPARLNEILDLQAAVLGDEKTPLPPGMMHNRRVDSEVEFRVALPFEQLTVEKLSELLAALRAVAHNPDMVIVHLRTGSTILRLWCTLANFEVLTRLGVNAPSLPKVEKITLRRTLARATQPEMTARATPRTNQPSQDGHLTKRSKNELQRLFVRSFTSEELRRFLVTQLHLNSVRDELPYSGASLEQLANRTVVLLEQHGAIDANLFARLVEERPQMADSIVQIAAHAGIEMRSACESVPPRDSSHKFSFPRASLALLISLVTASLLLLIYQTLQNEPEPISTNEFESRMLQHSGAITQCARKKFPQELRGVRIKAVWTREGKLTNLIPEGIAADDPTCVCLIDLLEGVVVTPPPASEQDVEIIPQLYVIP